MNRTVNVHLLPDLVEPDALTGRAAVVIDVLRATTTIAAALAAGADCVVPCLTVEEALRRREESGADVVLGGERGGVKIESFDLGNSPSEYTPTAVAGKTILFTTTNGTRALRRVERAGRVLLAAPVNLSAVCARLRDEPGVEIVCAGTNGQITAEDTLLAGAIASRLAADSPGAELNDQARLSVLAWQSLHAGQAAGAQPLPAALRDSLGGRNLLDIGLERDVEFAAQIDTLEIVPELNLDTGRIATTNVHDTRPTT